MTLLVSLVMFAFQGPSGELTSGEYTTHFLIKIPEISIKSLGKSQLKHSDINIKTSGLWQLLTLYFSRIITRNSRSHVSLSTNLVVAKHNCHFLIRYALI